MFCHHTFFAEKTVTLRRNFFVISLYIYFVRPLSHCCQIALFYQQIEVIQRFVLQKSGKSAIIFAGNERMCLQKSQ